MEFPRSTQILIILRVKFPQVFTSYIPITDIVWPCGCHCYTTWLVLGSESSGEGPETNTSTPCVARASGAMVLIMQGNQSQSSMRKGFPCAIRMSRNDRENKDGFCFLKQFSAWNINGDYHSLFHTPTGSPIWDVKQSKIITPAAILERHIDSLSSSNLYEVCMLVSLSS